MKWTFAVYDHTAQHHDGDDHHLQVKVLEEDESGTLL